MAHAQNEVEDMVAFAGALVLNIGTLTDDWVTSMIKAGKKASELQTPIILDPVGSGATPLRTEAAKKIIDQTRVSVIRGNASEILSLRDAESKTKGVDSIHSVEEAAKTATVLAQELNTALAITGPVDLITDGSTQHRSGHYRTGRSDHRRQPRDPGFKWTSPDGLCHRNRLHGNRNHWRILSRR
jgi:hydroxyethylthiazole kinase